MADIIRKLRGLVSGLRSADGLSRADPVPFEPFEIDGLTVRCQSHWPEDTAFLQAWNDLSIHLPSGTPFHSPAWQIAGWTAGRISGRVRFITVDRAGKLLAVLPLCLSPAGALHSPGASICDYLDPLMTPSDESACWRAILGFIAAHWDHRVNEFVLYNNRESAPCRTILPGLVDSSGFSLEEMLFDQAPAIALPKNWDAFLDSLDAHERKEIRRKLNKAETKGNAQLIRCENADEAKSLLDAALSTMEEKGGEKGASISGFVRPLLESAAPSLFREDRLEIHTLTILGKPAGHLILLIAPGGPMLYNLGYHAAMKEWSPGVVAVAMAIRNAIARGETKFDLLRGREPYKHKLGAVDRPIYRIVMKRK